VNRPSLVFLHIPKCGGTSLTRALHSAYPADRIFTDHGNLTPELFSAHGDMLDRPALFHGHAAHGTAAYFEGRATTLTLLRRPENQAVSNYLYIQRDPCSPWHEAALRLDLSTFFREFWFLTAFQTISISVPLTSGSFASREEFFAALPAIHAALERTDIVGCAETMEDVIARLAPILPSPCEMPGQLNRAADFGVCARRIAMLRWEYRELREDPDLAEPIAAEEATYRLARTLAARGAAPLWRMLLARAAGAVAYEKARASGPDAWLGHR